jgi:hypothetical protein
VSSLHAEKLRFPDQTFFQYGVTDRFQVGLGYLWKGSVTRPLANYTFFTETSSRPALTGGMMVDSLQGGRQGYFLTLSKNLTKEVGKPFSLYAGGAKVPSESGTRFIGGANLQLTRWLSLSVQYDGVHPTYGAAVKVGSINGQPVRFALLAVNGNSFGALGATRFALRPRS